MKRIRLGVTALLAVILLGGCTQVTELEPGQDELFAQYTANLLYKHSYSFLAAHPDYNKENPVPEETQTEEETAILIPDESGAETETGSTGEEETTAMDKQYRISEVLKINPAVVEYVSYDVTNSYAMNEYFSIDAEEGYTFIVVNFKISNPGYEDIVLNTKSIDPKPVFRAYFPDGKYYANYGTMITNELTNLSDVTLAPNDAMNAMLLFMVPPEYTNNLKEFKLSYHDIELEIR